MYSNESFLEQDKWCLANGETLGPSILPYLPFIVITRLVKTLTQNRHLKAHKKIFIYFTRATTLALWEACRRKAEACPVVTPNSATYRKVWPQGHSFTFNNKVRGWGEILCLIYVFVIMHTVFSTSNSCMLKKMCNSAPLGHTSRWAPEFRCNTGANYAWCNLTDWFCNRTTDRKNPGLNAPADSAFGIAILTCLCRQDGTVTSLHT